MEMEGNEMGKKERERYLSFERGVKRRGGWELWERQRKEIKLE